ncbi:4a-hydroxytetrahydrobiopterin dehydratase [Strigomonas culicis]|uniref:4a-hydroxytetrahydrobiopterin dehydratase n=1 Tax=Strigomonas culicis TaxID=28005 RepID=S9WJU4_9TRYP|nr:4a-hydroxytetrahydrobiopterin dehydratase [Strigomonas culicis]|eukprot:EPY36150.1 4a-hydroxytetrahydrobiopterin dehydratase [Strigomonas culicis]
MLRRTFTRCGPRPLSAPAITSALQDLPRWRLDGNSLSHIERDYVCRDFPQAVAFLQAVAPVCEAMGHHPLWANVHRRVNVKLTTHDAGNTVTQKDIDLAHAIEKAFKAL